MSQRQWKETDADDWDILWCEKEEVDQVFAKCRVPPNARVNHFRGYWNLCHKDKLYRNLKRHKQSLKKHGDIEGSNKYDFLPITYPFPAQYAIFIEEYKKNDLIWIMKPVCMSLFRFPNAKARGSTCSPHWIDWNLSITTRNTLSKSILPTPFVWEAGSLIWEYMP